MPAAFVTGGSGFVGGALIERLRREGWDVRALARSERAAERVRELGAEPVMGDLDDLRIEDCEIAFHAAAKVEDFGDPADFERVNVQGTRNVVAACRAGGVRRLVHVGTEAALMAGQPLVNVDESAPLQAGLAGAVLVLEGARRRRSFARWRDLETVVVRPRFVWGRGDTTPASGDHRDGPLGPLPLGGRRPPSHRHDPHRQHRRGPLARGDARARRAASGSSPTASRSSSASS